MRFRIMIALLVFPLLAPAQQAAYFEDWSEKQADSLRSIWITTTNDTLRMGTARRLGYYYQETIRDSSMYYYGEQLRLARQLKQPIWEGDALDGIGYAYLNLRDYPMAIQSQLDALRVLEDERAEDNAWCISRFAQDGNPRTARLTVLGVLNMDLGSLYRQTRNIPRALAQYRKVLVISEEIQNYDLQSTAHTHLASVYSAANNLDSALFHAKLGFELVNNPEYKELLGYAPKALGEVYLRKGDLLNARKYLFESITEYNRIKLLNYGLANAHIAVAQLYMKLGKMDSSIWNARKGIGMLQSIISPDDLSTAYQVLADVYQLQNRFDSAYKYQRLAMNENEKAFDLSKLSQFQDININEHLRLRKLEEEKVETQNKIQTYGLLSGVGVLLLVGILLYRNNRQKQRANAQLQLQRDQIQSTLTQLKSTQSQLIQSEKMASLGELTAGIAHEIQNPLNFVNNFSEVNKELISELKEAAAKGNLEEVNSIATTLEENEDKIVSHGKRADAIVKGMLQHSRKSSGQKEVTDINALCDEFLRLAYHGLRAKDKSFNAKFETSLDPGLPKVNVVPQEIGRVVLNLINNAFYAVNEKKNQNPVNYEPTVIVSTKRGGSPLGLPAEALSKAGAGGRAEMIEIRVSDNGNGIPTHIKEKIFQPFFTTKPTGQGTGLGLSLSYDIIIKGHGGELLVETKEGKGSTFTIVLPIP